VPFVGRAASATRGRLDWLCANPLVFLVAVLGRVFYSVQRSLHILERPQLGA
jgi:hypothetical protein